ncbi:hypothetical protein [Mesobacillus jeotgali]|uniref:hypothetical protein n=1 Tax=Mesobacillus jeotgali TaxID=129985 RepID=UPI0009A8B565|nr:hypothetical protein [Mesobacillus jeotgali]
MKKIEKSERDHDADLKKVLNIIGLFIFGGLALTSITNPMPADDFKEYWVFIAGSAIIYYFLLNLYFIGAPWRKVFNAILIFLGIGSLVMVVYLLGQSSH